MSPRSVILWLLFVVVCPTVAAADGRWNRGIVYGRAMLTPDERREYWTQLDELETDEEKRAFWEAHIERMQQLALERGVEIETPPNAAKRQLDQRKFSHVPYFRDLMTSEELQAYRDTVWHIDDDAERNAFVSTHILEMRSRAVSRGVTYPGLNPYEQAAVDASGLNIVPDHAPPGVPRGAVVGGESEVVAAPESDAGVGVPARGDSQEGVSEALSQTTETSPGT